MDDFSALAKGVALAGDDVRACLVVSSDGLVLGSHPSKADGPARTAWVRVAALGEVRKGFIELPDQVWAFVQRGPYSAFVLAGPSARPGVLIEQLQQALLAAEEARIRRDAVRLPESGQAPHTKPRTPLHPRTPRPVAEGAEEGPTGSSEAVRPVSGSTRRGASGGSVDDEGHEPATDQANPDAPEVDPVLLAKEFFGLLQMRDGADEGSS